jgi:8-amino-7-oxononanoate synthase
MDWQQRLQQELAQRRDAQLYRQRRLMDSPQAAHIRVDGRPCINFSSNDYLGLANHPRVIQAFTQASERFGVGSGASHLVCGHGTEHHQLEEELAQFTGREHALLFSTGYAANLGAITALVKKGDAIFADKLNHASLIDAAQLSGAKVQRFIHNDTHALQQRIAASTVPGNSLIAVDGVFSMDGDCAPLRELAAIARNNQALLMVDDAHGFGVLGKTGAGLIEHCAQGQDDVPVMMATLGKALGTFGAFVAGSADVIETLVQQARSYIYTTALPPAVAAAARESLRLLQVEGWRREHLQLLIARLRGGMEQLGLPPLPSNTAIQPLVLGDAGTALAVSDALFKLGFMVPAIRPPTVPRGTARLRITLSASHSEADVDSLLQALERVTQ